VGQADHEGHRQQEPLGPDQGDRGLYQKGVPRQGKQITIVFNGIYFLLTVLLAYGRYPVPHLSLVVACASPFFQENPHSF
jgi:hypothetical protein